MKTPSQTTHRRGVLVVWVAVMIVPLMAFVALSIDLGLVMSARSQCQIAADSAAMAGARTLNGNETASYNYSGATPNALAAASSNQILSNVIQSSQVNVEIGRYTYDDNEKKFKAQIPGPADEPWTLVKATVNYTGAYNFARVLGLNAFNTTATATAVHRPRDIAVVMDFSGSMRFDSLIGLNFYGDRTISNNSESIFPKFGPYSAIATAALQNTNAITQIGSEVFGSSNVTVTTAAGSAVVADFLASGTTAAFSAAPDSYETTPNGDVPLKDNQNIGANYATTVSRIANNNNTSAGPNATWEASGYLAWGMHTAFYGYTQGPRHWGKTFFVWPPDPTNDWRGRFFTNAGSSTAVNSNQQLWDASGVWKRAGDAGNYRIHYNAVLNWLKNTGPNPFPSTLRAGGILYYSAIPDSFTTITTNVDRPTFPEPPATQTAKDERFWKDYIDFVLGVEQTTSGGSYSLRTARNGYGNLFSWTPNGDALRISAKPAGHYMDYRDNPQRPRTQFWFGPMTLVDFLGNYNTGRFWWPGTAHEAPLWQQKIGIQAAIQDIKNNHPNDYLSLIYFSHPRSPGGTYDSTGRFNRARAPMGQEYDRLINALWYPLYVLDNPGQEISPYDTDSAKLIREAPNSQGGTCYAMGLMLAFNQFSANTALRTFNTTAGAPYGDAGGLGRKGAAKLLIFETDGVPTFSASAAFNNAGANESYYSVRAPTEFPTGVNNYGSSGSAGQPTTDAYSAVDQLVALDTATPPGYSTTRKPLLIHCLGFGTLFEPTCPNVTDQNAALDRLQTMQYKGGNAGGEQPTTTTPLPSYKRIVGTSAERIDKLREAFIKIMQDGVQISLIE